MWLKGCFWQFEHIQKSDALLLTLINIFTQNITADFIQSSQVTALYKNILPMLNYTQFLKLIIIINNKSSIEVKKKNSGNHKPWRWLWQSSGVN